MATAAAFALFLITLARVPIPWGDEIWMASASQSLAEGGRGIPSALPPGPYGTLPHVYGPVFFYLCAVFIRLLVCRRSRSGWCAYSAPPCSSQRPRGLRDRPGLAPGGPRLPVRW